MKFMRQRKAFKYLLTGIGCLGCLNLSYATSITQFQDQNASKLSKIQVTSNAIAAGSYATTAFTTRPLLAYTQDGGTTWFYPSTVLAGLPADMSYLASFTGAICSVQNCLASGFYQRLLPTSTTPVSYPILGLSQDFGVTWTYPGTITSTVTSDFSSGSFTGSPWCSGTNCIVAGNYLSSSASPHVQKPLLANSNDAGSTWNYPPTILSNLPSDFLDQGVFNASTCRGTNCVAVGQYESLLGPTFYPLLSNSNDGGITWTYPTDIKTNLPVNFLNAGIFKSVSCGIEACVAVGEYTANMPSSPHYPLVAISPTGSGTWSYPVSVLTNLPKDFLSTPTVSSVSCNANNCIAVGQYSSSKAGSLLYPLLLSSNDGGMTWSYPLTIVKNLPADFRTTGIFNGAVCNRNVCIAVGTYQSKVFNNQLMPLLANSLDGGATWSYPPSVIANLATLPNTILNGTFTSISCNRDDCNAQGQYQSTLPGVPFFPLLATSHDAGLTWSYSTTVLSNLPSDYFNHGLFSAGNSSHPLKKK